MQSSEVQRNWFLNPSVSEACSALDFPFIRRFSLYLLSQLESLHHPTSTSSLIKIWWAIGKLTYDAVWDRIFVIRWISIERSMRGKNFSIWQDKSRHRGEVFSRFKSLPRQTNSLPCASWSWPETFPQGKGCTCPNVGFLGLDNLSSQLSKSRWSLPWLKWSLTHK